MKKILIFLAGIIVVFGLIFAINQYQKSQKLANNPYPTNNLNSETIALIDDPNYQNLVMPEELEESLENGGTETVYFFSPICSHCREATPVVVPLAEELGVNLKLYNTLEFNDEAAPYKIEGTPSYIRYENGKEVSRIVGNVLYEDGQPLSQYEGSYTDPEFKEWLNSWFETFEE